MLMESLVSDLDRGELQDRWWDIAHDLCAIIRPRLNKLYTISPGDDLDEAALNHMWGLLDDRCEATPAEIVLLNKLDAIDARIKELGRWERAD